MKKAHSRTRGSSYCEDEDLHVFQEPKTVQQEACACALASKARGELSETLNGRPTIDRPYDQPGYTKGGTAKRSVCTALDQKDPIT